MTSRLKSRVKRLADRIARYILDLDAHNIQRARQRQALSETADLVTRFMEMVIPYSDRFALYEATSETSPFSGLVCEFGVYRGESINFIAGHLPDIPVYGFDSFRRTSRELAR